MGRKYHPNYNPVRKRAQYKDRRESGLCVLCGHKNAGPNVKCPSCHQTWLDTTRRNRKNRLAQGRCAYCDESLLSSYHCKKHYLMNLARLHLRCRSDWMQLHELFEAQDGACPYTGRKLTMGVDSSIDHKIPKALGGKSVIENLQWVYEPVNTAKQDLGEEEFLSLIREIHEHVTSASAG